MSDMTLCLPREDSFLHKQPPVEQTHPDWKLIRCPVCGDGCYISPDHVTTLARYPSMEAACTICALHGRKEDEKRKRLIDISKRMREWNELLGVHYPNMPHQTLGEFLMNAPTVDALEVVHARWIKDGDVVVCSNCGEEHGWDEYRATYCEDCGAKMDGE